jgi:hypothetical protein
MATKALAAAPVIVTTQTSPTTPLGDIAELLLFTTEML